MPRMDEPIFLAKIQSAPLDFMRQDSCEIHNNRKPQLIGGVRAWNKEEEAYLLQTRLQKIPYKHIAAHLKKTELACRLHYHHLSHSCRRKKAFSASPSSTPNSPNKKKQSRLSVNQSGSGNLQAQSPPQYFSSTGQNLQLPSTSMLFSHSESPPPPWNLEKPHSRHYQYNSNFTCVKNNEKFQNTTELYSNSMEISQVNLERLSYIYEKHRALFWQTIASEYGQGAYPLDLEKAWKQNAQNLLPLTPCASPKANMFYGSMTRCDHHYREQTHQDSIPENRSSVSISDLLEIDESF
ncbi:hypothetical protein GcM3_080026 [Golovinomyces cichoracearum]|uniref:Myb-like domain-containing protein n=1 Tax=Golovinomyces cichoracearum TaxID=62708 RepID=A0A420INQ6_9PEZI|nr:hypothetical protein GcM3_080026 [Golovinomyces cichoracearum]